MDKQDALLTSRISDLIYDAAAYEIVHARQIDSIVAVSQFQAWSNEFNSALEGIIQRYAHRGALYQRLYDSSLIKGGLGSEEQISSKLENILSRAREAGKLGRREIEIMMAQKGGSAAQHVLSYQSSGRIRQFYTDEQYSLLKRGSWPSHPLSDVQSEKIEIHHRIPVKHDRSNMIMASDPENTALSTHRSHLEDYHGGRWNRYLPNDNNEVMSNKDRLMHFKQQEIEKAQNREEIISIAFGLLVGSLSAIIEFRKLKDEPWNVNKVARIMGTFAYGYIGSGVAPMILNNVAEDMADDFVNILQNSLLENNTELAGDISEAISPALSIMFIRGFVIITKSAFEIKSYGYKYVIRESGGKVGQLILEQTMLAIAQAILDDRTNIPDAKLQAIMKTIRIGIAVGKSAWGIYDIVMANKKLQNLKIELLYNYAINFGYEVSDKHLLNQY